MDDPNDIHSWLIYHKIIFYLIMFMVFYSHMCVAIIDPGLITPYNNKIMIELYYLLHKKFIGRAQRITEKKGKWEMKKLIFSAEKIRKINRLTELNNEEESSDLIEGKKKDNKNSGDNGDKDKLIKEEINLDDSDSSSSFDYSDDGVCSEYDDKKYDKITSIKEETMKLLQKKYGIKLTRCGNCFVVRPLNGHHCSICKGCILNHDHHCPWMNNCIGFWNKKYFILFNFYSLILNIHAWAIYIYYLLFKNYSLLQKGDNFALFRIILEFFLGLFYGLFCGILFHEQIDNMKSEKTECDFRRGKLLEKSSLLEQAELAFGEKFSFRWFLPFWDGGRRSEYLRIWKAVEDMKKEKGKEKEGEDGKCWNEQEDDECDSAGDTEKDGDTQCLNEQKCNKNENTNKRREASNKQFGEGNKEANNTFLDDDINNMKLDEREKRDSRIS